jgi:hypothetical protein
VSTTAIGDKAMNTTDTLPAQAYYQAQNSFPQTKSVKLPLLSHETRAELVNEARDRGWIGLSSWRRAASKAANGKLSVRQLYILLCSGAINAEQRRVQVLKLLLARGE